MLKRHGLKFETRLNGEQLRKVRRFTGAGRFVYNKALALNKDQYDRKEKRLGYIGMAALLPGWKEDFSWLSDAPARALQQSLKDLERAYVNFFHKRANCPIFRKKGKSDRFRIPQDFEVAGHVRSQAMFSNGEKRSSDARVAEEHIDVIQP